MDVQTVVPEAIKKQGNEADALHRKLYPDQYPAGGEQTQGKEAAQGAAKPEEGKPAEAAKPGEPAKEAAKEAPAEDWKQKYDTLQGKYNAEVPGLHQTVAALKNQLQEAANKIMALEAQAKAPAPEKVEEKAAAENGDDTDDPSLKTFKEEYPDIFEAVKKIVAAKPKEAPAKEAPKAPAAAAPPATDPRATFTYYLNRDMPDWRQVNVDPEFIASLNVSDPNSPGHTKLETIQGAYDAADFTTVIGLFRDFKASKAAGSPAADTAEKKQEGLSNEEKHLAPPRGGRAPAGADTGSAVTVQELTKFYDDSRKGIWGPITGENFRKEEARLLAALMKKT